MTGFGFFTVAKVITLYRAPNRTKFNSYEVDEMIVVTTEQCRRSKDRRGFGDGSR